MKFKILFVSDKKVPIKSGYRPDWCSNNKPYYNCAQLIFNDKDSIMLGEKHECLLEPLCPVLWNNIMINDALKCMEGSKQVGKAIVLDIISP